MRKVGLILTCLLFFGIAGGVHAGQDRIVYTCTPFGLPQDLCVIDPDGGSPVNLTQTNLANEMQGSFSPDGTKIAFFADYDPSGSDLFVTLASGSGEAINISQTEDSWESGNPASWSPDGSRLVYETHYFSSAPPNLGNDVQISPASGASAPVPFGSTQSQEGAPQFSPDGTKIAYASRGASGVNGVMVGPADGSSPPALLAGAALGLSPVWSPNGDRILMEYTPLGPSPSTVRIVRTDGSGQYVDLETYSTITNEFDWSPDGTKVVWDTNDNKLRVNSSTDPDDFIEFDPGDMVVTRRPEFSPDGTRILFAGRDPEDPDFLSRLFLVPATGGTATPITPEDVNSEGASWMPLAVGPTGPTGPTQPTGPTGPTGPTQPPKTVKFAQFRGTITYVPGAPMRIAAVNCNVQGSKGTNPICQYSGTGTGSGFTSGRSRLASASAGRKVVIAKGFLRVKSGKKKPFKLKPTRAGKKLLKPGRKVRMRVTITQKIKGKKTRRMSKTVTVKVKGRR